MSVLFSYSYVNYSNWYVYLTSSNTFYIPISHTLWLYSYQAAASANAYDAFMALYPYSVSLPGTKKSCEEGGCGACTAMLSYYDVKDKKIR